jgi:hypothetical protein
MFNVVIFMVDSGFKLVHKLVGKSKLEVEISAKSKYQEPRPTSNSQDQVQFCSDVSYRSTFNSFIAFFQSTNKLQRPASTKDLGVRIYHCRLHFNALNSITSFSAIIVQSVENCNELNEI